MNQSQNLNDSECQQYKTFVLKQTCPDLFKQKLKLIINKKWCQYDFNKMIQNGFIQQLQHRELGWSIKESQLFFKQFLSYAEILTVEIFCHFNNSIFPQILVMLSPIKFQNLRTIFILQNFIDNIQPLTWLLAPNLKQLLLEQNRISSIKPLQKVNYQNLCQLNLLDNRFTDRKYLCRSKISRQGIRLDLQITQNIFILVKIQSLRLLKFKYFENFRPLREKQSDQKKFCERFQIKW